MTEDQEYRMRQALYGPTPKEIREKCLEIQKTWSPWMRAYRAGLIKGEPRGWLWYNGRSNCYETEFGWTVPQYVVRMTMIGQSEDRRYRDTAVWRRV